MKETIRKIVLRLFPELASGIHLPRLAMVTGVADAPDQGGICDPFRPRLAVNVRMLDEHWNIDESQPEIEAVPVTIPAGGMERGFAALPEPGAVVEIAFAYGKQSQPFVRSVMPFRLSLPEIDSATMRWQQSAASYQEVDRAGNWSRITNATITDDALQHVTRCVEQIREVVNEIATITGDSSTDVTGIRKITAGAIKAMAAGSANIGAGANVNLTAAQDINQKAGRNNKSEAIGYQQIQGAKVWVGSSTENLLQLVSEFMQSTIEALAVLAGHTHPDVGTIAQGGDVATRKNQITAQRVRLELIKKI